MTTMHCMRMAGGGAGGCGPQLWPDVVPSVGRGADGRVVRSYKAWMRRAWPQAWCPARWQQARARLPGQYYCNKVYI